MTKQKTYSVAKYFDDYYEKTIEKNLSLEDAEKLKYSLKPGVYVSYEVRED